MAHSGFAFTSARTSPAVGASFGGNGTAHPSTKPHSAFGGVLRTKTPTDRGAYEIGATTKIPNAPTHVTVQ